MIPWILCAALVAVIVWQARKRRRGRAPARAPAAPPHSDTARVTVADAESDAVDAIAIADELDLHAVPGRDIAGLVAEFVLVSRQNGRSVVTVVHGRGTGTLRRRVRALLERDPGVRRIADASGRAGGATAVWLAPLAEPERRD